MEIIFGTVQFGIDYGINNKTGKPSEVEVFKMLDFALKNRIKLLDTADAYGNAIKVIGKFNKTNPNKFSINTKFIKSKYSLKSQLIKSLKFLNVPHIETYFYHSFGDFIRYPELIKELLALKNDKLISRIGLSVYDNSEFEAAIYSEVIDVIQLPFNLLDNQTKRGHLIKMAKEKGKELHARSIFLQGLFFKNISDIPSKLTPLIPYLKELSLISNEYGIDINKLAILYAYYQPDIDYIIIGVDNFEQLKSNISILKDKLLPEIKARVDLIEVKQTELLYPKNWN